MQRADRRRKGPRFDANVIRMLEISGDLAALCRDGVVVEVNPAGCRMLGAAANQVIGQAFARFVAPEYAPILGEILGLAMIETEPTPVRLRRADGEPAEAALAIYPARELGPGVAVIAGRDLSAEGKLAKKARESERRLKRLVENAMHLICQCKDDHIVYMNRAGLEMLHANVDQSRLAWPVDDLFYGEYRDIFAENRAAFLAEPTVLPVRLRRKDGTPIDAQILITLLPAPPGGGASGTHYMLEARDITGHNRAVAALRAMNESLEQKVVERTVELAQGKLFVESVLESVPSPLWWKGVDGRLLGYNGAFRRWHGIDGKAWIGRRLDEVISEHYVGPPPDTDIDAADAAADGGHVEYEAMIGERSVVVFKTAWSDTGNQPAGVIGVMLDISERKAMEAELRRLATTDVLTGCKNRRHFLEVGNAEFAHARRSGRPLAVLMLDIDHFKRINDTYGHPVGDRVIKALADTCSKGIRPQDALGRLGGEEFGIVLGETAPEAAVVVAERLRAAIAAIAIPHDGKVVACTGSIGVANLAAEDKSIEMMLSRADRALYLAKRTGRDRVCAIPNEPLVAGAP